MKTTVKRIFAAAAASAMLMASASCGRVETLTNTEPSTASDSAASTAAAENVSFETVNATDAATETTAASIFTSEYDRSTVYGATALKNGDDLTGGTYVAEGDDESALEASGTLKSSVTGAAIVKSGGSASDADDASFTGINSAVRVSDGATLNLSECQIESTADNATGVFAYGSGVINISDSVVEVSGGGAGGVQVAGGGTLNGSNLIVTSAGKAAIRSDRGGGTMKLTGGTYTSTGSNGCPAIYSTADITVSDAVCVSEKSRAVIIEGKNSVSLYNCDLTGNDQSTKEGSIRANVLLYQSASGDAENGASVFTMEGGSMKCMSGAMFYCTNTSSVINLKNAELIGSGGELLIVSAGRWGSDGSNGGDCELNAENQTLEGDVIVDEISKLSMNLKNSSFTGSIDGGGSVAVTLDSGSVWTLTGDSYVTSLSGNTAGINTNGYTLYVNGEAFTA